MPAQLCFCVPFHFFRAVLGGAAAGDGFALQLLIPIPVNGLGHALEIAFNDL